MKRFIFILLCLPAFLSALASEIKPAYIPENFGESGKFTVMTWAYVPSELGPINAKGFGVKAYTLISRGSQQTGVQFCIGIKEGLPEFRMYTAGKGWYGLNASSISKSNLPKLESNRWFHIAAVADSGTMTLYVNGIKVGTKTNLPPCPQCCEPALFGALKIRNCYWDQRFPGYLDKAAFEPRALSESDISVLYEVQRDNLVPTPTGIRPYKKPVMSEKLPIVQKWEMQHETQPFRKGGSCVAKVVLSGGRPRVELNGKIVDATLAMPPVLKNLQTNTLVLRDFAAAGVKFYMDIWNTRGKLNDWWLGPGEYNFKAFDDRMWAILEAAPDGYVIPRLKLDPPQWWEQDHPEAMQDGYVVPGCQAWHELFEGMLRDVVTHIEDSPYSGRVVGYNFGALVGSEWISRSKDKDPDGTSTAALKAARVIKEVTGGTKLTGVFFGYPLGEHANLMKLVESPDIDFFCSPISYNGRRAGEPGRFSTPYQASYRLHGKLYWSEADERTHLSEWHGIWHPSWHQADAFETEGAMLRDLGWALSSGHEIWWFAIAGPETFHDEKIMQTVQAGLKLSENRPDKPRVSELAVFSPVWYDPDPEEKRDKILKGGFLNFVVPCCGVPFDSYELSDLSNPSLPKYKAAIVITGAHGYMPQPADPNMKLLVFTNEKDLPTTPSQLRDWCASVGAHVWCESDDTFGAGCGFAFIHAGSEGDKKITFPNGRTWKGKMKFGETKIVRY